MDPALTPDLALAYLRELSADVRAGVVLDAQGARLAGPRALADVAAEVRAAASAQTELELRSADGWVFAARSPAHFLLVVTAPLALAGLVRHDLRAVLGELSEDRGAPATPGAADERAAGVAVPAALVERVVAAANADAPD
jgi:hypothetical protein